jgi:hypothetical protein
VQIGDHVLAVSAAPQAGEHHARAVDERVVMVSHFSSVEAFHVIPERFIASE